MNSGNDNLEQWLHNTLLFQGLSPFQLSQILEVAQFQSWAKNEIIFEQDTPATGFFVVKTGRVKVYRISPTGKEQILNIFESGDNFAEVAALDGQPFPAAAAALDHVELVFFPRSDFIRLLHTDPSIAINMLISLSKHLRHLVGLIETLSFKDVSQRLAEYLLKLSDSKIEAVGNPRQLSDTVTLDLTKTQLAATLGTIPATLSRAFNRLADEGIVTVNGLQVTILDRDRLRVLSQSEKLGDRSFCVSE
ncbi:Crp/Fnr family transcriptional regulator [Fischerella thermalis]|uniref:Crp/Fnr family transcriptional regulator n=1 Tax=Fischerella thermalis TaxID=372787 RepID=UPI00307E7FB8